MKVNNILLITGITFSIVGSMHLFPGVKEDLAHAANQAILAQMQDIPSSSEGIQMVQAAAPELNSWKGHTQAGLRSRAIMLNSQLQDEQPLRKGTNLVTHLFDDLKIQSNVLQSTRNSNGVTVTTAQIEGSQWGRVFIASSNGKVRAKILVPKQKKVFAIEYNKNDDLHYALELDPQLLQPEEDEPLLPPHALFTPGQESIDQMMETLSITGEDESTDATTVVDVMVVYSNDALSYAGSVDEIDKIIALGIAMANDAHESTNTGIFLHLVHSALVDYTGSGNRSTDLERLYEASDGYMDEVHTLRNTYGADFVSLIPGDYSGDGGVAYLLIDPSGDSAGAFSVVNAPIFDSYTTAHEIGHNMGLSHAKDQNYQAGPTSWITDPYNFADSSAGWHWHPVANTAGYSSVMAYSSGQYYSDGLDHSRVGLFSDPDISYEGLPCGHVNDGYNALVLRSLKDVYASYRNRPISANSIVVDYPNGGENFSAGSIQYIQWDSNGVAGNVKIELLNNGSLDQVIAANTLNDRVYSWTLPSNLSGKNYTIRISNLDGSISDSSDVVFSVKSVIYDHDMDTSPEYSTSGDWEFGSPSGLNSYYGGADSAYTGTNIYDTDLDYVAFQTGYLTSIAFDCSEYEDVELSFMGWFSVTSMYNAIVEVSNDNTTWTPLSSVSDIWTSNWKEYSFDISSYADEQATVYVRWGHVSTTGGSNYSGMSVDDVKIIGVKKATPVTTPTTSIVPVLMMLLMAN
jgi:hypothetical protein